MRVLNLHSVHNVEYEGSDLISVSGRVEVSFIKVLKRK